MGAEAAGTDLLPVRSMPPDRRLPPKVAEGRIRLVHNFGILKLLCGLSTLELSAEEANFHSPALSLDLLLLSCLAVMVSHPLEPFSFCQLSLRSPVVTDLHSGLKLLPLPHSSTPLRPSSEGSHCSTLLLSVPALQSWTPNSLGTRILHLTM